MHNSFIRTLGVWSGDAVVSVAEFEAFDLRQFQSINGDLGGAWAPSSIITIGGSGLEVAGAPFSADDVSFIVMSGELNVDGGNGASILLDNSAEMLLDNAAQIRLTGGAKILIQPSSTVSISNGAIFELGSSVNPTYTGGGRTVVRKGLRLRSCTVAGGSPNSGASASTDPDAFVANSEVYQKRLTAVGTVTYRLDIPDPIDGATLTQIKIKSTGFFPAAGQPASYPTYTPYRSASGALTSMRAAGAVTDQHSVSVTWFASQQTTTIACDQNNVIDKTLYEYVIVCTPAADGGGASVSFEDVEATYTVPDLRPG